METQDFQRQYHIDWLRVISIGLLIIYHIADGFQRFADLTEFNVSKESVEILLIPMSLINVMRIPLLFFVAGIGIFFSIQTRNWMQILGERTKRILIPLVFGSTAIVPIYQYLVAEFYFSLFVYFQNMGHLWFLLNIFVYSLLFLPLLFYIKRNSKGKFFIFLQNLIEKYPFCIYLLTIPYILQSLAIPSDIPYTEYILPQVGFLLGAIAFVTGFTIVALGQVTWIAVSKIKYFSIGFAFALFLIRFLVFDTESPHLLTAIESTLWIMGAFGFGYKFLNKPSKTLNYLRQAAYPFYIIHLIFLYLGAHIILPLNLGTWIPLVLIIGFTFTTSFLAYELIKRIFFVRPLFGLKM